MASPAMRWVGLGAAAAMIFAATIAIGLKVLPGPHGEIDYLVIGSAATLISLALVFAAFLSPGALFRRRSKPRD